MLNEKVDIEIRGRRLTVEMEGLTQLEVVSLAGAVAEKMKEIERDSNVVDSYKLALLAALDFAAEASRLQTQLEDQRALESRKLDEMIVTLQGAVGPKQTLGV